MLIFCLAVLALLLSPGPNMMFVVSHGIAHGSRGGVAAAAGICAADVVMTLLSATGITAIVAAWPPSFNLLRLIGAAYLLWLAARALCTSSNIAIENPSSTPVFTIFRMAMVNSLCNPKALLFFIVFLPQFVVPTKGDIALQIIILGCVLAVEALIFHVVLGVFSGRVGVFLSQRPRFAKYQSRVLSAALIALALRLLLLERPAAR